MYGANAEKLENKQSLSKGLTLVLAMASGVCVANIYYNQPLLADIARTFNITSDAAGLISTFTQLGYAIGLFLFVPLGDIKEKRKLILCLIMLVTISLLGVASAQTIMWMYIASLAVGITAVAPQVIIPLAAQLARPEERGKVIGTIVSGLLLGILLARTVSGYVGHIAGWRSMFVIAALLMCILAIILYFTLPSTYSNIQLTYKELLKSTVSIARKYRTLQQASITAAMMFGAFSVFWTTLIFLLESPPYHFNSSQAGLFGLFGVSGALGAMIVGRMNDKKDSRSLVIICIVIGLISYLILGIYSLFIWGLILGVILLDLGLQGTQVSNQTRIYSLNDEERSRINTVYMVSNFTGGAVGSYLGALAWNLYGWTGVCMVGGSMILVALGVNVRRK